jgi:hypothetical protein
MIPPEGNVYARNLGANQDAAGKFIASSDPVVKAGNGISGIEREILHGMRRKREALQGRTSRQDQVHDLIPFYDAAEPWRGGIKTINHCAVV